MIRIKGKYRIRVSNRVAVVAALILAVIALLGSVPGQRAAGNSAAPAHEASAGEASESSTDPVRGLSLLLFRHG